MNLIPSQQKSIFSKTEDKREKISFISIKLSLANDCYLIKLHLLIAITISAYFGN